MASTSGSEVTLSSSTGRWITNAGKTAHKSAAYDVALTFTDDTELANIIGVATQANSDGTDYDLVETSAITGVSSTNAVVDAPITKVVYDGAHLLTLFSVGP